MPDATTTTTSTTTASTSGPAPGKANAPARPAERERDKPRPLGDHLEELRRVLIRGLIAAFLAVGVCFVGFGDQLVGFCLAPLRMTSPFLGHAPIPDAGDLAATAAAAAANPQDAHDPPRLITIHALDRFKLIMTGAIVGGLVLAGPYLFWLLWGFISVGLYPHERRLVHVFLPSSVGLFICGGAFGYFIMLPIAIDFLLHFGGEGLAGIHTDLLVSDYLTYFFVLTAVLGFVFQIPLGMTILLRVTDITPEMLVSARRYVIVFALVIGMLLTPPDPFTQLMVATPMVFLYEIGLIFGRRAHLKRKAEHEAAMAGENPWTELLDGESGGEASTATAPAPKPTPPSPAPAAAPAPASAPAASAPAAEPVIAAAPVPASAPAAEATTPAPSHPADVPVEITEEPCDTDEQPVERPAAVAPWATPPPTPEATGIVEVSEAVTPPPPPPPAATIPPVEPTIHAPGLASGLVSPFSRNDDGEERYQLTREEIAELVRYEVAATLERDLPQLIADEVKRALQPPPPPPPPPPPSPAEAATPAPQPATDADAEESDDHHHQDDSPAGSPMPPLRLRENLDDVRTRIAAAAARSGRSAGDITLCAVTKTATADDVRNLIALGVTHFGENRLQVAEPKLAALADVRDSATWHMIGHVQRNKAKRMLELFDVFHTVDSTRL
ncbi:MAG: twin-arginine translocase subunit TatC, partial [Planctomycetota bacterium]